MRLYVDCLLCILLAVSATASQDILGCWRSDSPETVTMIRFEPERVLWYQDGALRVARPEYLPDQVVLHSWGRTSTWKVGLTGEGLEVSSSGTTRVFARLADVPPELDLRPAPLGEATALAAERRQAIQQELSDRRRRDQEARAAIAEDPKPEQVEALRQVDADNSAYLKQLVAEVGWISTDRFGPPAADAAFLIVQHSRDLPLMMAALPEIEKDVRAGKIDPQDYALLYDRLQLDLGRKQRYGTQLTRTAEGQWAIAPLQDREKVEEFRKEIGLFTFATYLEMMQDMLKVEELPFME